MAGDLQEFDTLEYVSNSNLIGHSLVFSFQLNVVRLFQFHCLYNCHMLNPQLAPLGNNRFYLLY